MVFVTYNTTTGALVNVSDVLPSPNPEHCTRAINVDSVTVESWNPVTLRFDEERDPHAERNISGVQYLRRFTQDERIAIRDKAKVVAELDDYLKLLDITIAQGGVIDLNDTDTIAVVTLLEAVGLIAPGRAAEVLA